MYSSHSYSRKGRARSLLSIRMSRRLTPAYAVDKVRGFENAVAALS